MISHLLWVSSLLCFMFALGVFAEDAPDLVPAKPATAPNYWCTWYAQNYWIGRNTDLKDLRGVSNQAAREEINTHTLFNAEDGWVTTYLPRGREDYIFLIDHGWQTQEAAERVAGGGAFFNLVADPRDFPPYAGLGPKEVLRRFNSDVQKAGWRSLGLWVRGNVTPEEARTFVDWSKSAGITYWKIDGGDTRDFNAFNVKEEIYPELVLEYVTGAGGNINPGSTEDLPSYPSVYEIGQQLQKPMLNVVKNCDVFRTYDASPLLMTVTTLRRTHDILKQTQQQPEYRAILNVQDDCNAAIGLGVLVASKRHPNYMERTLHGKDLHHQLSGKRHMQGRINEAERFARWSRIAPAFPAGVGTYLASEHELIDQCTFSNYDTWAGWTYGRMISQSAPAVMARNMPLPEVESEGEAPFVCATTYPNGPLGIATEGRVKPEDHWFHPRARVTVRVRDGAQPIGIAGHYQALVLEFAGSIEAVRHVWAQDLLARSAVDIKSEVVITGNTITLPGELIDRIGTSAGDEGDQSAPGLVIQLEGESLPHAGHDFVPDVKPVTKGPAVAAPVPQGESDGVAKITVVPYGFHVKGAGPSVAMKPLKQRIDSGRAEIRWTMKPVDPAHRTKNGFLVLSSDQKAVTSILAGSWIGSNEVTLFENKGDWARGSKKRFKPGQKLDCVLALDIDLRTARLTINGVSMDLAFSESVTSVNYIGFGVLNAETLFSEVEIVRPQFE